MTPARVCTALFTLLAAWVTTTSAAEKFEPVTLPIGSAAPDFKLKNAVDDKEYALADFKDAKVLAIIFTTNHCPTANAYEQRIIDLLKTTELIGSRTSSFIRLGTVNGAW